MESFKKSGLVLAGVACALLASGFVAEVSANDKHEGKVKCMGMNACKGKGACKSSNNDCKGKNACKGKGITKTATEEECTKGGGTVAQ